MGRPKKVVEEVKEKKDVKVKGDGMFGTPEDGKLFGETKADKY